VDQALAQRADDRRHRREGVEGEDLDDEDVGRLLRVAAMRVDEVLEFVAAPFRIEIIL